MRVRALDANGDRKFGRGLQDFYIDQPEAVAQCAKTRLGFWLGEWFLDTTDGTPWETKVLGKYTAPVRDAVIRARILGTLGVNRIISYYSNFNPRTRAWSAGVVLDTIYGKTRTLALDPVALRNFTPSLLSTNDGQLVVTAGGDPITTNTGLRTS